MWFTDLACATAKAPGTCAIGEINPTTHAISEFSAGLNPGSRPGTITAGPDGNLWFTDAGCGSTKTLGTCAIGEVNPTTDAISEFSSGLNPGSLPALIAARPDGSMWFTDHGLVRAIGRITVPPAPTHALTVSVGGTGAGRVTASGISCTGTCAHSYASGTSVTLTATPTGGSRFVGWGGACSGAGTCSVTMSGDRAVTATFAKANVVPPKATRISTAKIDRKHQTATFTFKAGPATSFRCALLKSTRGKNEKKPTVHFSRCSSPKTYRHLHAGHYTFEVRAIVGLTAGPITRDTFRI